MTNDPRPVSAATKFAILRQNPVLLALGCSFLGFALLFGGVSYGLSRALADPEIADVDYDQIVRDGQSAEGTITATEVDYNTTINGEHPLVITYTYKSGVRDVQSKIQTLASNQNIQTGDKVDVKYLNEQSVIVGMKPFHFPFWVFYSVAAPFFVAGIICLALLFLRINKRVQLYKYGIVTKAEIIDRTLTSGMPVSNVGFGFVTHYQYKTSTGQNILAKEKARNILSPQDQQSNTIKIFVSPNDESVSCLIPNLEAVRNNWEIL